MTITPDMIVPAEAVVARLRADAARLLTADPQRADLLRLCATIEVALGLLGEVHQWHCDPQSNDYNECEKDPCHWCANYLALKQGDLRAWSQLL